VAEKPEAKNYEDPDGGNTVRGERMVHEETLFRRNWMLRDDWRFMVMFAMSRL
jgi:hypothetical protein